MRTDGTFNVRYMVDGVDGAIAFYTTSFDFEVLTSAAPASPVGYGSPCEG